jgi:hypothetical protein
VPKKKPVPAMDWEPSSRTGQPCPKCGAEIVYNGNYFCSQFQHSGPKDEWNTCDWAMEQDDDGPLFKRCYSGLMANRRKAGKA